jgi:hypothetical protein
MELWWKDTDRVKQNVTLSTTNPTQTGLESKHGLHGDSLEANRLSMMEEGGQIQIPALRNHWYFPLSMTAAGHQSHFGLPCLKSIPVDAVTCNDNKIMCILLFFHLTLLNLVYFATLYQIYD